MKYDTRDPAHVALNRAQRRAIDPRPGAVFVAVPHGSPFATGDRFTIPEMQRSGAGEWVKCAPGDETLLTAVVCR